MITKILDWLFVNEEVIELLEQELLSEEKKTEYWRSMCHKILRQTGDVRLPGGIFEFDKVVVGGVHINHKDGYSVLSAYPKPDLGEQCWPEEETQAYKEEWI